MKLRWITLGAAIAMATAMGVASGLKGWHSTPSFWTAGLNFPGIIAGIWTGILFGESMLVTILVTVLVNWAFYYWTVKGILLLKRRASR